MKSIYLRYYWGAPLPWADTLLNCHLTSLIPLQLRSPSPKMLWGTVCPRDHIQKTVILHQVCPFPPCGAVPTGSEAFKHSLMTYSSGYTLEHVIHTSHKHTSLVGCNAGCGLFHSYHTGNQPASHTQHCCLSGRHEGQWR